MTTLIFVRHGETDWNVEGRWQGQIDVPLNTKGHQEARRMAEMLVRLPISVIYSSDLSRAFETASYLAEKTKLTVQKDARLREIHQGVWQGMKIDKIQREYNTRFQTRKKRPLQVAPPGGETVRQVGERVLSFLAEIVPRHPQDTVVIVTHGFVMALVKVLLEDQPFESIWENIPKSGAWHEYTIPDGYLNQVSTRLQLE